MPLGDPDARTHHWVGHIWIGLIWIPYARGRVRAAGRWYADLLLTALLLQNES
jgi:hypothetical protein